MKAKNWASRPHCPPGDHEAVNMHKSIASGMTMPKSERKTKVDLGDGGPGAVGTPGWFRTGRK